MGGGGAQVLERQNIWTLSRQDPWHPTIAWYATGVGALMGNTNLSDPNSWMYLANIHGTVMPPANWPPGVTWNACQHGSWFFLPWHRIYLHFFEKAVRAAIVAQGGPADWALPYWYYDPHDTLTLELPPAFRTPALPTGAPNPLYTPKRNTVFGQNVNAGDGLPAIDVTLPPGGFSSTFTGSWPAPSFGGPVTGWHHSAGPTGQLEAGIHGNVHVDVGGPVGLMSAFETAGQDPIFWLHHSNIDRMWEVWRSKSGDLNPTDPSWLDMDFHFGSGAVQLDMKVQDVLDITAAPLLYRYEGAWIVDVGIRPPRATELLAAAPLPRDPGGPVEELMAMRPARLVGATETALPLTDEATHASIAVTPQKVEAAAELGIERVAPAAQSGPKHTYLTLENVTGSGLASGTYGVYLNVPEGSQPQDHPDNNVGQFSMFGVQEASAREDEHGGSGLSFSFDISGIAENLAKSGRWDPSAVRVSVAPTVKWPQGEGSGEVRIGRIGIYQD